MCKWGWNRSNIDDNDGYFQKTGKAGVVNNGWRLTESEQASSQILTPLDMFQVPREEAHNNRKRKGSSGDLAVPFEEVCFYRENREESVSKKRKRKKTCVLTFLGAGLL